MGGGDRVDESGVRVGDHQPRVPRSLHVLPMESSPREVDSASGKCNASMYGFICLEHGHRPRARAQRRWWLPAAARDA